MELDQKDFDVVQLLAKLKTSEPPYPSELLALRRQGYVQRVAEIGLGLGIPSGGKTSTKAGGSAGATTSISGIIEMALALAIVAEAGAAAYIYRNQIADFIRSFSPHTEVSEVVPPSENATPLPEIIGTALPETTETPPVTFTTTSTTVPTNFLTAVVENNDETDNQSDIQAASTPDLKDNNGNHFGQTPKPERTKENDNNNEDGRDKGKDK